MRRPEKQVAELESGHAIGQEASSPRRACFGKRLGCVRRTEGITVLLECTVREGDCGPR